MGIGAAWTRVERVDGRVAAHAESVSMV